jgi:5-methylcytosine-specific restriction endonuclease McrA
MESWRKQAGQTYSKRVKEGLIIPSFLGRKHSEETKRHIGSTLNKKLEVPSSILEVSSRTTRKILKRLGIACLNCGWDEDVCDLHHIKSLREGGDSNHENLTYICPNCHRLVHSKKIDKSDLVSLAESVGDKWKKHYYV